MGRAVEHDPAVRRIQTRLSCLILSLVMSPACLGMNCSLLVVSDWSSGINSLTAQEVRRIYLGVAHPGPDGILRPLRNQSDAVLHEVFLQKILYMSGNAYRYALASRLVRQRVAGPPEYDNQDKLIDQLHADRNAISYLLAKDLPEDGGLKVLLSQPCDPR